MRTLEEEIRSARKGKKLSQRALGRLLGMPQSHLSAIESGKTDPRTSTLIEIARQLDHELILVPRKLLPAVTALLGDSVPSAKLWQSDGDEEEET